MEGRLERFFAAMAERFLCGDASELALLYAHPLAVFSKGEISIEQTPETTRAAILRRRNRAREAGTVAIRSRTLEIGDQSLARFPVIVEWDYLGADGEVLDTSRLRYFCSLDEDGAPRIEILEFIKQAFPRA